MTKDLQSRYAGIGGTLLQSGIPHRRVPQDPRDPRGLLVRGVVVGTYVTDDPDLQLHPSDTATGVYCDILVYSSVPSIRYQVLRAVPVLQPRAGLHSGRIWKPRAASFDLTGFPFDAEMTTRPNNMDGDHVLIGFQDNSFNQPIILGEIPHPNGDSGNENKSTGHRLRLKLVDGDPYFQKHHGSFYGIDTAGNHVTDTTFANTGALDGTGKEPAPPTDGSGRQHSLLPQDAERRTEFLDMSNPSSPVAVASEVLEKDRLALWLKDQVDLLLDQFKLELKLQEGATLKVEGKDAAAKATVGNGVVSATIAERLQTLYNQLITTAIVGLSAWGASHVHPTAWGPSGPPAPTLVCPPWDPTIPSTKLKFPDL